MNLPDALFLRAFVESYIHGRNRRDPPGVCLVRAYHEAMNQTGATDPEAADALTSVIAQFTIPPGMPRLTADETAWLRVLLRTLTDLGTPTDDALLAACQIATHAIPITPLHTRRLLDLLAAHTDDHPSHGVIAPVMG